MPRASRASARTWSSINATTKTPGIATWWSASKRMSEMLINEDLEATILANPDDDAPYLVYADWLQSHGDPRGELMAVQVALEKDPDDESLLALETSLLDDHHDHFMGAVEYDDDTVKLTWRRGFFEKARFGG